MGNRSGNLRLTKVKPLHVIATPAGPGTPLGSNKNRGSYVVQPTDLKERNAAHYNGIVSTETKPGLVIRGCYFHSISDGVCRCWMRCPARRKAAPGFPRPDLRASCHVHRGDKFRKILFFTPSLHTLTYVLIPVYIMRCMP